MLRERGKSADATTTALRRKWTGLTAAEGWRGVWGICLSKLGSPECQMARTFALLFMLCSAVYLYLDCRMRASELHGVTNPPLTEPPKYLPPGAAALYQKKLEMERAKNLITHSDQQTHNILPDPQAPSQPQQQPAQGAPPPRPPPPPPPPVYNPLARPPPGGPSSSQTISSTPVASEQCKHLLPNCTVNSTYPLPVVFMHVPKSAGTTLAWPVRCIYGNEYQQILASATKDNLFKSTRALIGHVKFGTHELFPENNATYVIWFREPIQRTISHYYYHYYSPQDRYHLWAKQNTLGNWVNNLTDANNLYTQFISGRYGVPADEEAFELAVANLRKYFKVVGLVEKWHETLVMFKEYLGWKDISFPRPTKVNRRKPDVAHHPDLIDEETMKNITAANYWDLKLYEIAKQMYEEHSKALGPLLDCEVEVLKSQTGSSWRNCLVRRAPPIVRKRPGPPPRPAAPPKPLPQQLQRLEERTLGSLL